MSQVANTYAFLPREAVSYYLMSCSTCKQRIQRFNSILLKHGRPLSPVSDLVSFNFKVYFAKKNGIKENNDKKEDLERARARKPTKNHKSRDDFRPSLQYFTHFDCETKPMSKSMAE